MTRHMLLLCIKNVCKWAPKNVQETSAHHYSNSPNWKHLKSPTIETTNKLYHVSVTHHWNEWTVLLCATWTKLIVLKEARRKYIKCCINFETQKSEGGFLWEEKKVISGQRYRRAFWEVDILCHHVAVTLMGSSVVIQKVYSHDLCTSLFEYNVTI